MPKHPFWWALTIACVLWYSAITWYVALRGARDIQELLKRLRTKHQTEAQSKNKSEPSNSNN